MALLVDEAYLPATLTVPPMTDEEFAEFCAEHPDLFFEMTAEGELVIMPPTHTATGVRNSRISAQLDAWAWEDGRGVATDSSAGFVLPNGARRSPDAAWTLKDAIRQLPVASQEGFWHLAPTFVIELRSDSDRLGTVQAKMREYIENGTQLGWLIDPKTRTVEVYRPNAVVQVFSGRDTLSGDGLLDGFVMDLRRVWNPLG
jgi:Uma2 family endonuclease